MRHGPVGFAVWGWSIRETADDPDSTRNPFRAIFLSFPFPGDRSGTIGSSPWSKRPASGSLIYDAETMICNQNFPCYLSLIDRQFINLEKGVSCFFTKKQNRLFPYMTHAINHINCDLNNYNTKRKQKSYEAFYYWLWDFAKKYSFIRQSTNDHAFIIHHIFQTCYFLYS